MRDLSLHILDLAENSVRAGAKLITIGVSADKDKLITLTIADDGCGMSRELLERVMSPFGTTRTTRKVGLGIPLMAQNARLTGGDIAIQSKEGEGTVFTATLHGDSIDCLPLGDLAGTVSYVVLINVAATFLIPLVIPLVNPSATMDFWVYVGHIALKVFPVLILPGLVAWVIRYTTHRLQRRLMRWATNSFYVWGVGLTLAMVLATRALLLSGLGWGAVSGIVLVSLVSCFAQFFAGRQMGRKAVEGLTAGQALGQKNTGFLIWLGYNYMTPVTSVAGGLYAIWQNLFNSWELYEKSREKEA